MSFTTIPGGSRRPGSFLFCHTERGSAISLFSRGPITCRLTGVSAVQTKVPARFCRSFLHGRKPRRNYTMIPENPLWPARRRLVCPDCHSESLRIKPLAGWERLIVLLCDLRKYGCNECGLWFRAKDRRRYPREECSSLSPWSIGLPVQRWAEPGCTQAWAKLSGNDSAREPGARMLP